MKENLSDQDSALLVEWEKLLKGERQIQQTCERQKQTIESQLQVQHASEVRIKNLESALQVAEDRMVKISSQLQKNTRDNRDYLTLTQKFESVKSKLSEVEKEKEDLKEKFEQEKVNIIEEHLSRQDLLRKEFSEKIEALERRYDSERKTLESEKIYALNNAEGEYIDSLKMKEAELDEVRQTFEKKILALEEELCDCRRQVKADGYQQKMNAMRSHYENTIAGLKRELEELRNSGDFQAAKLPVAKKKRVSFDLFSEAFKTPMESAKEPTAEQPRSHTKRKLFSSSVFPMQF